LDKNLVGCPDTPKVERSIIAVDVDAIQDQDMKVGIEVESRAEALDRRHRTGGAIFLWIR
jgi:hypothetical protein